MTHLFGTSAYQYPGAVHVRRHGPHGYIDYKSYKPWLRDEFTFRCVYCLTRERWCHDGAHGFGVDHLVAKALRPDLECDYANLLYLCNRCNSAKRVSAGIDPCSCAMAEHLTIRDDGSIRAKTKEGQHVIDAFNLNYPIALEFRKRKIELLTRSDESGDEWTIQQELAYPTDLPNLSNRNCENSLPLGIAGSCCARQLRGELDSTY